MLNWIEGGKNSKLVAVPVMVRGEDKLEVDPM